MASPVFSWNAKTTEDKAASGSYSTTLPKTKNTDPTLAGSLIRSIIKPVARIGRTVAGSDLENDPYLGKVTQIGVKGQKEIDAMKANGIKPTTKQYLKAAGKDLLDIFGTSAEIASNFVGGEGAVGLAENVGKQTLKTAVKNAAIDGGISGALQGGGSAAQEGKNLKGIAKDTLTSGIIGAGLGVGLAGLGKGFSWNKGVTKAAEDVVTDVPKPSIVPAEVKAPVMRGTKPNPMNADKVAYEPYTPDAQLPVIQMGQRAKSDLPTIQTQVATRKAPGDFTYEPIATPKQDVKLAKPVVNDVGTQAPFTTKSTPSSMVTVAKPFVEDGTKTPVSVAKPFKAETPKQTPRLTEKDFSKSAFENTTWQRESKLYSELSDEEVQSIASGKTKAKNGANSTYVWTEAKLKAIDEGDVQKIKELADSPVGSSKAAQDLQFGKNAKMANDPVEAIQEIQKARAEKLDKRTVKEFKDQAKQILTDAKESFFREIECK